MKFPIGLRLFLALLCSSFAVAAISLLLLSGSVLNVFSDYTVKIDLDRLDEVANDISSSYTQKGDWSFLPTSAEDRRYWFGVSFNRLNQERVEKRSEAKPIQPLPPIPPLAPKSSKTPTPPSAPKQAVAAISPAAPAPAAPAAPAAPPAPPPPPPLPPLPSNLDPLSGPDPYIAADPNLLAKHGDLYLRVTLLDQHSNYLAGLRENHIGQDQRALYAHGNLIGYLVVKRSNNRPDEITARFLNAYRETIIRFVMFSVILSAVLATILAIHFRRPLIRLRDGTQQLAQGQYATRLEIRRSDELGELADNFNLLAEKLESIEKERRLWVADTSHELRTPVSVIRAQIEALQDGVRAPTPENLALLLRQILALDKLINDLYLHAQIDAESYQLHLEEVDLIACLDEVSRGYEEKLKRANLHFSFDHRHHESLTLQLDRARLTQVLSNLIENAIRYTAAPGEVALSLTEDLNSIQILLEDSAPGLNQDQLQQLGQRFYRPDTGRSRQHGGSGLGLSLCVRIVQAHGGKIQFGPSRLGGLAVHISLPKHTPLTPAAEKGQAR